MGHTIASRLAHPLTIRTPSVNIQKLIIISSTSSFSLEITMMKKSLQFLDSYCLHM